MRALLITAFVLAGMDYGVQTEQPKSRQNQQERKQDPPPTVSSQTQPTATAQQDKPKYEPAEDLWHDAFGPVTWPNWFVVIVGAVGIIAALRTLRAVEQQVFLMGRQTRATEIAADAAKKSAEVAEMALRLSERADILLESAGLTTGQEEVDGDSAITINFKNFGRTRANNVRFRILLDCPDLPDTPDGPEPPPTILGAGYNQRVTFKKLRECFNKNTFNRIVNGQTTLSFRGEITYEDVFGDQHITKCSGVFDPQSRMFRHSENVAS